jgi:hypothetical protein
MSAARLAISSARAVLTPDRGFDRMFTGRADELRRLSPWLSGEGDAPLYVVTAAPVWVSQRTVRRCT